MSDEPLIGTSEAARYLERDIFDAARTDAKVLLTGESGVGKELVANKIHQQSRRRTGRLLAINCAAVPDSLLESELFGHMRGSFTGAYRDKPGLLELANNGTIFLDEIGETSVRMQALLLRFLENGEVWRIGGDRVQTHSNARVIAATNRDLQDRIAEREFRSDLYYRLNVLHITIPPLRERRDDIPLLLDHFFRVIANQHGARLPELTTAAQTTLMAYGWPGNVRELKNLIERLIVRQRRRIDVCDLPPEMLGARTGQSTRPSGALAVRPSRADELYDRMVIDGESFWSAVYPVFIERDMTREDLRAIVTRGLTCTRGNYRLVVQLFNMSSEDYKSFLNFLRKHNCHIPFFKFRCCAEPTEAEHPDAGNGAVHRLQMAH